MQKKTKLKLTIFCLVVGMFCMFTAVVSDHWAVLSPKVTEVNSTCEAAHFGLWRLCKKNLYITDVERIGHSCGPISLPGEHNCTYFRHFTPGEESEVLDMTTQREYSISAAAIAIFSVAFMILGTICAIAALAQGQDYIYKPAGMFYAFAGLCAIISVEVMRQSVKRMIDSRETIWIEYYYSWSFACAVSGCILLFVCGLGLLLLAMPQMPRNPWESCMDSEPEQME
ncbi:calcium channel, voltage-dependent, gamma subunit 1a [Clupea harengus]|uniref:Voltage-dependent calcium channel gamma-1 subunit n=1 Tax=Clupea harengus TaxID=7950 RepID=A0A6P3VWP8_CLUHA|nr:calcium channel, voltage-dependent, gamma subunit 1a [Clupea harengus]